MTRTMGQWVGAFIAVASTAMAQELFVAPARYSVLQVLFDIARIRPVGLMSYQGNARSEQPALHAWTGEEWVPVPLERFRDGSFASVRPRRIALLGDAELLPPVIAEAAQQLATVVVNWTNLESAAIINAAGRWLEFSTSEWAWFAGRYWMNLVDENAPRRRDSWYYHSHPHLRRELRVRRRDSPPPAPTVPAAPVTLRMSAETTAPTNVPVSSAGPSTPPPPSFVPNAMWEPPESPSGAPARDGIK